MTALVTGFGSIGARHVAVLTELGIGCVTVSRRPGADHRTIAEALAEHDDITYAVVATETEHHAAALAELAAAGFDGRVLVEKPVVARPDQLAAAYDTGLDIAVGYNLRYHPALAELRAWTEAHEAVSVQIRAGHDLRQWRPGRAPSATASAALGSGGVLRDLSHELDALLWLFGDWTRAVAMTRTDTAGLGIASEVVATALVEMASGALVSLELNYLDAEPHRTIVACAGTGTAAVDLIAGTFHVGTARTTYPIDRNDTYRWMHRDCLRPDGPPTTACTLAEGSAVVALVEAIERSAATGAWIANRGVPEAGLAPAGRLGPARRFLEPVVVG